MPPPQTPSEEPADVAALPADVAALPADAAAPPADAAALPAPADSSQIVAPTGPPNPFQASASSVANTVTNPDASAAINNSQNSSITVAMPFYAKDKTYTLKFVRLPFRPSPYEFGRRYLAGNGRPPKDVKPKDWDRVLNAAHTHFYEYFGARGKEYKLDKDSKSGGKREEVKLGLAFARDNGLLRERAIQCLVSDGALPVDFIDDNC